MFTFYKIFDIEEETVVWKGLDGVIFLLKKEGHYITIDVYESPDNTTINDLLCDYTYNEDLMGLETLDVKNRLDELIRIDKIRKLLK